MATADETGDLASVMRRVRKLMALANDGRGDVNEMAAAAEMAAKIMAKYRLDYADVLAAELKAGARFAEREFTTPAYGRAKIRAKRWYSVLAVVVAQVNECNMESFGEAGVRFYGLEADVEIAGYMMDYLGDQVHRVAQAYQVLTKSSNTADEFALGMVRGICAKLKEMIPAGDGPGIVLATKRNVLREHYGREMVIRYRKAAHSAHTAAGAVAGSRVDVGRRGMGSAVGGQNLLK